MRELISTLKKKKKAQARNEWSKHSPKIPAKVRKKPPPFIYHDKHPVFCLHLFSDILMISQEYLKFHEKIPTVY